MKIGLIAGKSGDTLTKELKQLGYEVHLIIGKKNESGHEYADATLVSDLRNHDEILDYLTKNNIQKIILGTGHRFAIDLVKYLELNEIKSSVDVERSVFAKSKIAFKEFTESIGLHTPSSQYFKEKDYPKLRDLRPILPKVVKSNNDVLNPVKCNNMKQFKDAIEDLINLKSDIIIEEFIDGVDATVMIAATNDYVKDFGILYYNKNLTWALKGFDQIDQGTLKTEIEKKVINNARKCITEGKFIGLTRVDFVVQENIPYILELNTIIVTGSKGDIYRMYQEKDVNIAKEAVKVSLDNLGLKNG